MALGVRQRETQLLCSSKSKLIDSRDHIRLCRIREPGRPQVPFNPNKATLKAPEDTLLSDEMGGNRLLCQGQGDHVTTQWRCFPLITPVIPQSQWQPDALYWHSTERGAELATVKECISGKGAGNGLSGTRRSHRAGETSFQCVDQLDPK